MRRNLLSVVALGVRLKKESLTPCILITNAEGLEQSERSDSRVSQ